jgi:hypothetical protein
MVNYGVGYFEARICLSFELNAVAKPGRTCYEYYTAGISAFFITDLVMPSALVDTRHFPLTSPSSHAMYSPISKEPRLTGGPFIPHLSAVKRGLQDVLLGTR